MRACVVCLTGLVATWCFASPDPALWQELDLVPMPREVELTGREVNLVGADIVLGREPSTQDEIGAQWIADEIVRLGGQRPTVVRTGELTPAALHLVVGTRTSNPLIAAVADRLQVGPGQPGERGYVISSEGRTVLLAGADPIGALYACVTFGELLMSREGQVLWREARVRDWPDYLHVLLGDPRIGGTLMPELQELFSRARSLAGPDEQFRQQYLTAIRRTYDWLLRRKVSGFQYNFLLSVFESVTPAGRALIREGIEYGKQRGIGALVYAMGPFAGLATEYPQLAQQRPCLGPGRYPEWIRCWSLDDMRRQTADKFARFCGELGLTDVGFHDTDTGGFLNPAEWNDRCQTCRQRWGDDYCAATAHIFRIYYDALKEHAPGARMNATIYPYNIGIFTQEGAERYIATRYGAGPGVPEQARQLREKWSEFWRRITRLLPEDIIFCMRETSAENVDAWRELLGSRGVFVWYGQFNRPWHSLYADTPSMVGSFFRDQRDYMFPMGEQGFIPAMALATREYCWNINAPGAQPWFQHPEGEQWRHHEPQGEAWTVVLPHVTRNLFGRRFDEELTRALALNVCAREIFAERPELLKSAERMQWQADNAAEGMRIMDHIWAQRRDQQDLVCWDEFTFRRIVYLRERFHCAYFMAAARAQNLRARELARAGKRAEAEQALARGRQLVELGRADEQMLVAQRPADPIYECARGNNWMRAFREFTPGVNMDYGLAERELEQTEKELPALEAAAGVPEDVLKQLEGNRVVQVSYTDDSITVDGLLHESAWAGAYPSESFFIYREGNKLASAHTRVRLLYDRQRLYIGGTCWVPDGGEPVAQQRQRDEDILQDDALEIFLVPGGWGGSYAHLMVNALGCWRDTRLDKVTGVAGLTSYDRHPEWNPETLQVRTTQRPGRWDVEMSIALAELGGTDGTWRANFAREFRSAQGPTELSSLLPAAASNFHDLPQYRSVVFSPPGFRAPGPEVSLEFSQPRPSTRTLPDRIATVCSFGVVINCSRVLHDAELTAELYGEDGRLHLRQKLVAVPAMLYCWQAEEPYQLAFETPVARGGIRLLLVSEEGVWERWWRLGGWPGTTEAGAVVRDGVLVGECALPSKIVPAGADVSVDLLHADAGTIELRFLPLWSGQRNGFYRKFDVNPLTHVLVHFGPVRTDYIYTVNFSSLVIELHSTSYLRAASYLRDYCGWSVQANLDGQEGWEPHRWHHLAVVWDSRTPLSDGLRIYLDGRRVSGEPQVIKPERMNNPDSVRVYNAEPYALQLGCIVNGRRPGRVYLDDLRISRVARYSADFAPPAGPPALDADTTALLSFDEGLTGAGRTVDGTQYAVQAVAGAVEYH